MVTPRNFVNVTVGEIWLEIEMEIFDGEHWEIKRTFVWKH